MSPESRSSFALVTVSLMTLVNSGCIGGITAGEVSKENPSPPGIRYFLPAKYLVIRQLADGKWDADIQSVVDRTHEFYVQPWTYFSSGSTTIEFNPDGTLKSFKLVANNTDVPIAGINALKDIQLEREKLAQDALAQRTKKPSGGLPLPSLPSRETRAVFLYRIDGDHIVGPNTPIANVAVSVSNSQPPPPGGQLPKSLTAGLMLAPDKDDPRTIVASWSQPLTLNKDIGRFHFFMDPLGKNEIQGVQRNDIISAAREVGGKVLFVDIGNVQAISLSPQ